MTDLFPAARPQTIEDIQLVYDKAYANGILEEELIHDPDNGVIAARIEDGKLIETIRGQNDRVS